MGYLEILVFVIAGFLIITSPAVFCSGKEKGVDWFFLMLYALLIITSGITVLFENSLPLEWIAIGFAGLLNLSLHLLGLYKHRNLKQAASEEANFPKKE